MRLFNIFPLLSYLRVNFSPPQKKQSAAFNAHARRVCGGNYRLIPIQIGVSFLLVLQRAIQPDSAAVIFIGQTELLFFYDIKGSGMQQKNCYPELYYCANAEFF
jgi:hypothetical protein